MLQASAARKALSGFFLMGLLMSFLGAILPSWGYHLRSDFSGAGGYFLAMAVGIVASIKVAHSLVPKNWVSYALVVGSAAACGALLYLAAVPLSFSAWWRIGGVLALGFSSGLLTSGVFYVVAPAYRLEPAATVNLAGAVFVMGSLVTALLVAGTFYVYTAGSILILLALVPGLFAGIFAESGLKLEGVGEHPPWRQVWEDSKTPAAVLSSLLLFFQFGNEWTLAGWLPIFLIQRLGVSPALSLMLLAVYWLALLVGRGVAQFALPRVRHGWLLAGSVVAALFGCLALSFTKTVFGAVCAILFMGGGFATIFPLTAEKIGRRFPYFHPGFFHGIFSFAITGGLLAPWSVGYFADWWGLRAIMAVPLLGTCMVTLLLVLIWVEAKLTGAESARSG